MSNDQKVAEVDALLGAACDFLIDVAAVAILKARYRVAADRSDTSIDARIEAANLAQSIGKAKDDLAKHRRALVELVAENMRE